MWSKEATSFVFLLISLSQASSIEKCELDYSCLTNLVFDYEVDQQYGKLIHQVLQKVEDCHQKTDSIVTEFDMIMKGQLEAVNNKMQKLTGTIGRILNNNDTEECRAFSQECSKTMENTNKIESHLEKIRNHLDKKDCVLCAPCQ